MVLQEVQAGLETVRPGRKLFVRQVRLGQPAAAGTSAAAVRIVFMHGTCATEQQFQLLLEAMDRRLSKKQQKKETFVTSVHCLLYDLVGCGRSPPANEWDAYANEESMSDLKALLDRYCCTDTASDDVPTILLGHSYAPNIFLRLLVEQQHQQLTSLINLQGVILMSTSVRCQHLIQQDGGHVLMRLPLAVLNCLQSIMTNAFIEMAVHPSHTELRKAIRDDSNNNSMQVAKAYHRHMIWASPSVLQQALNSKTKQQLPVLIVHGVDDGIISLQCAQYLANQLPQSELVVVEQASHLVMMEQPERVAGSVLEFLEQIMKKL